MKYVSDPLMVGTVFDRDVLPDPRIQKAGKVDLLFGYNTDDGSMFAGLFADRNKYRDFIKNTFPVHSEEIMSKYPADDRTARSVLGKLITTISFHTPLIAYGDAMSANGAKVYAYQFDYLTERIREDGLGVRHIAELNFVFEKLLNLVGAEDEKGKAVARLINSAFSGFIRNGDPNAGMEEAGVILREGSWNPYHLQDRQIFRISSVSRSERVEGLEEMMYFDRLLNEEFHT